MYKVVFMGTPEFSCNILNTLFAMDDIEVVLVVSQPDKKVGRKQEIVETPVKKLALEHGVEVFQPENIKLDYQHILDSNADCIITCAYGQIIPEALLNGFKYDCINVHASLLPKYRGGAPIHMAIINGEKESGITIMKMVKKMDAGDMLYQKKVTIDLNDTCSSLHDKLGECGSKCIQEFLPKYFLNEYIAIPQDEQQVSFAFNISKEMEYIDLNDTYDNVYNKIRGLISWPVGYVYYGSKKVKLHGVEYSDDKYLAANGTIIGLINDKLAIVIDNRIMYLTYLQMEGKKKICAKDFYNGIKNNEIKKFGE